jgi:hypothetical protein
VDHGSCAPAINTRQIISIYTYADVLPLPSCSKMQFVESRLHPKQQTPRTSQFARRLARPAFECETCIVATSSPRYRLCSMVCKTYIDPPDLFVQSIHVPISTSKNHSSVHICFRLVDCLIHISNMQPS